MQNKSVFYCIKTCISKVVLFQFSLLMSEREFSSRTYSLHLFVHLGLFFFISFTDTLTMIYALCFRVFINNDMRWETLKDQVFKLLKLLEWICT